MSYAVSEWVVKNCHQTGSKKLAMMILAFHSDDKGECFPSLETLSKEVEVNERQMRVILRDLETTGEIETVSGGGRRTNTYRILGYIKASKSCANPVEGQGATGVIHNPPHTQNHPSGGLSTTPLAESLPITNIPKITPLGGSGQPLWGAVHNPSGGLSTTPELKYNKPLSTIEQTEKEKSIVAPVGDDTAPTPLLESQTTTPEGKDTHQPQETGKPRQSVTPTIEGVQKRKSTPKTNLVDNTTIKPNTPPIAPPQSDKVRVLTDQQQMVGAIVKAFGWSFDRMTKNNRGLVGKVARELLEASATPDQIPALYEFCKGQKWSNGIFSPGALASQWANFCANQATESTGEVFRVWKAPDGYVGVKFDYPPRLIDTVIVDSDGIEELTPAQIREQMNQTIKKLADKFSAVEEIPMSEDDPMNEVLTW